MIHDRLHNLTTENQFTDMRVYFYTHEKMSPDANEIYKSIFYQQNNCVQLYFTHIWKHLLVVILGSFLQENGIIYQQICVLPLSLLQPTTFYDFILL